MGRGKNRSKRNKRYRHEGGVLVDVTKNPPETKVVVPVETKKKEPEKRTPVANATNFKITIPHHVYCKIMHWINKANFEVSGFGSLDYDEQAQEFRVRDVILLKQKVGPGSAEICPIALNRAMYQMRDEPNALKWHWHSHVNMNVFWSGDDMEIIRSLGQQGWIVASVFNKREEVKTAFLTQTQVLGKPHDVFVDDIKTFIEMSPREEALNKQIKALQEELKNINAVPDDVKLVLDQEYEKMVEPERSVGVSHYSGGWNGHYSPGWDDEWPHGYPDHRDRRHANPTADERRWAPSTRAIGENEYDEGGYACVDNDLMYNPCYDQQVKTPMDMLVAIDNMEWNEISAMRKISSKFDSEVNKYFAWKASHPNMTPGERDDEMDELDLDDDEIEELKEQGVLPENYQPQWCGE